MTRTILFIAVMQLFALEALCQDSAIQRSKSIKCPKPATPRTFKDIMAKVSLRQSFQGKLEKDEAAFFNIVTPRDKPSSYNLSVALAYNVFCEAKLSTLRPFVEWQKNTVADKPQNVFLGGLDYQLQGWDPAAPGRTRIWTPYIIIKGNYKNDMVKKTEGAQSSILFTPAFNSKAGKFYPVPDAVNSLGIVEFYYNIYVGAEYENRIQSATPAVEGSVLRGYGRITASIYFLPKPLKKRLEFIPDYTYRHALSNHSGTEKDVNRLWKWNMNLVILTKDQSGIADFKFGIDYMKGVDPTKGFDDQKVITYSFKIKI